jgi:hypothetical protein
VCIFGKGKKGADKECNASRDIARAVGQYRRRWCDVEQRKRSGALDQAPSHGRLSLRVFIGWISAQMIFGIQYMRIYYSDQQASEAQRATRDLNFPGQLPPDLWDFMYFSFSIAMT